MTRRLLLATVVVAGLVVAFAVASGPPETPVLPAGSPSRVSGPSVPNVPEEVDTPWSSQADRLATACGIDVVSACTPTGCAALAVVPDLDRLPGWLELGWANPGLVAGTVLADLGVVSRESLPCDAALLATSTDGPTRVDIGDGPDGTWVACVWAPSTPDGEVTPCAEAAGRLGLPWTVSDPHRRW